MNKFPPALRWILFLILPWIGGYFLIKSGVHASGVTQYVQIGMGVVLLIIGIVSIGGFFTRCSSCKYWFTAERVERQVLEKEKGTKIKTLTDTVKNRKGEIIRTTEKQVAIPVERTLYKDSMKCSHCHYNWTEESVTEREL